MSKFLLKANIVPSVRTSELKAQAKGQKDMLSMVLSLIATFPRTTKRDRIYAEVRKLREHIASEETQT
jgi:hypothetical protein